MSNMEQMTREQRIEAFKESANGYVDLGWANGWEHYDRETQQLITKPEVQACRDAGHKRRQMDIGWRPARGLDNLVVCDICRYQYHYDCSD